MNIRSSISWLRSVLRPDDRDLSRNAAGFSQHGRTLLGLSLLVLFTCGGKCMAAGLPEPSLVYYGVVRDTATGTRLTVGSMRWVLQPTGGGQAVVVQTALTNIGDQFSYVLFVPVETALPGQPITTNTLALSPTPVNYDRSQVTVGGVAAALQAPAPLTFDLSLADRGLVERVDLTVNIEPIDTDGNGLLDNWEIANFGSIGQDPNGDPDGDGMTNLEEQKAGTDPNDFASQFAFIHITQDSEGGVTVEWSSVAGRVYSVLRSGTLLGGYTPIATGLTATPPSNSYLDATAVGAGPYFYLLQLEEEGQ